MRVWRFQHTTAVEQNRHRILSYYFDLQSVYITVTNLHAGMQKHIGEIFVTICGFELVEITLVMVFSCL